MNDLKYVVCHIGIAWNHLGTSCVLYFSLFLFSPLLVSSFQARSAVFFLICLNLISEPLSPLLEETTQDVLNKRIGLAKGNQQTKHRRGLRRRSSMACRVAFLLLGVMCAFLLIQLGSAQVNAAKQPFAHRFGQPPVPLYILTPPGGVSPYNNYGKQCLFLLSGLKVLVPLMPLPIFFFFLIFIFFFFFSFFPPLFFFFF